MYDNTCRFLAENYSADFASWLLGETVTMTELKPSELSLDPIRADVLILLQSDDDILHIEFQMAASAILAGLRLEEDVIYQLVRRDIMQESVIYRSIQRDEKLAIARNLLQQGVSVEVVSIGTGLSIEEVQQIQSQMNQPSQAKLVHKD
jgi:predicted transposase YdaD